MTTPEHRVPGRIFAACFAGCLRTRVSRPSRRLAGVATLMLLLALGAVFFIPSSPAAQKPYALIFGTVFASNGRVAYGIPVKVRRADKKKSLMEAMSDHSGEFAFRVPPGPADYIVWADFKDAGKKSKETKDATSQSQAGMELKVHVEGDERVDISLHLP